MSILRGLHFSIPATLNLVANVTQNHVFKVPMQKLNRHKPPRTAGIGLNTPVPNINVNTISTATLLSMYTLQSIRCTIILLNSEERQGKLEELDIEEPPTTP